MDKRAMQLTEQEVVEIQQRVNETKIAAEKAGDVLRKSAASLLEAKEAMILALLAEEIDPAVISQATKTDMGKVMALKADLEKSDCI